MFGGQFVANAATAAQDAVVALETPQEERTMDQQNLVQLVGAVSDLAAQGAKAGVKSSEFWLHVLSFVPMALAATGVAATPVGWGIGAAAVLGSAVYSICRSGVKKKGLEVVAGAAPAIADAIKAAAQP